MRIRNLNDLHLEFDPFKDDFHGALRSNGKYDADVLILAGDIVTKSDVRWIDLIACNYKHVIYIFGNHEYYGGRIDKVEHQTREKLAHLDNVHILQNESVMIDGINFHGSTLWTDFDRGNPLTMSAAAGAMNDYKMIKYKNGDNYYKFGPRDAMREFQIAKLFLMDNVKEGDVVVTHMAPSFESIAPEYKGDKLNGAFASDLSDLMLDNKPSFWAHGHVHNTCDYVIGETRVLCNPRGYVGHELNPDFDINAYFEI